MKQLALILALSFLSGAAAADELLRVYLSPADSPQCVAELGADVLFLFDDGCLARAGNAAAARVAGSYRCEPVEPGEVLVYVMPDDGFDRAVLARYGAVVTQDGSGVLLRTTGARVGELNRLPLELARVSMRPMVFAPSPAARPAAVPDSLVRMLVGRVSQDSLEANLRRLIGFYTRDAMTESCYRAVNWMRQRLAAGCDSTFIDSFEFGYAPNVVGIKTGTVNPRRVYVVCGHIDDASELMPPGFAPGSDDNASGAGLVVELARVFDDIDFESTVWFIGFSAEEYGLVGSDSFAYGCRRRGDSIALAINFDMVSYGRDDSATIVWTSALPQTESLAHFFLAQADTFTELKAKDTLFRTANSDHASFWKYGFLAIRGRYHDRTPKYHTTGDTIGPFHYVNCGTNNLPLYTEMTKATVATIAKLAGAHQPTGVSEAKPGRVVRPLSVTPTIGAAPFRFDGNQTRVSIYDATGRFVAATSASWDGKGAGAGVYYARAGAAAVRFIKTR